MIRQRCGGFTLLELLLVLVIAGLLASQAAPQFQQLLSRVQFDHQYQQLVGSLQKTARQARRERRTIELTLTRSQLRNSRQVLFQAEDSQLHWQSPSQTGALRFYPDGSNSGGLLSLRTEQYAQKIRLHWLTGEVESYAR